MLKKLLFSLRDNVKQKTANPFLVTLVIVWLFRNYHNIFKLLSSSNNINYKERIAVLDALLKPEHLILNIFECAFISFIVLIVAYFLLNLSRLIINFYEKVVTPWVYKASDRSSVVSKETHEKVLSDNISLQSKFEEEKDNRIQLEGEIQSLEKRIRALISEKYNKETNN